MQQTEIILLATLATILAAAVTAYVIREAVLSRRNPPQVSKGDGRSMAHPLIGRNAYVTTAIRHLGTVTIDDETWTAQSKDQSVIEARAWVIVTDVQGLKVTVQRSSEREEDSKWQQA